MYIKQLLPWKCSRPLPYYNHVQHVKPLSNKHLLSSVTFMCIWPQGQQDVKYIDFQHIQCTLKIVVDKLMSIDFIILSQSSGCLMEAFFFLLPACQSIFVFDALHRQCGSGVTDNQHPASDRRKGRIHGVALSATFVTPVTSCGRRLINGVSCGSQRTSVSSHRNVQVCVCPSLNRTLTTTSTFLRHPSAHCFCMTLKEG